MQGLSGRHVIAWAPKDPGAIGRLMSHYLRAPRSELPASICFLAALPTFPGAATPAQFFDLWPHPLAGEKYSALIRAIHFLPQPVEMVFAGRHGPRQVRQGIACFHVSHSGKRSPPAVVLPKRPTTETKSS